MLSIRPHYIPTRIRPMSTIKDRIALLYAQKIYFVRLHDFVKIGISSDVRKRMRHLQSGSPYPLELIRLIPDGNIELEARFHAFYKDQHANFEWFTFSEDMLTITAGELPPYDPEFRLYRRRVSHVKVFEPPTNLKLIGPPPESHKGRADLLREIHNIGESLFSIEKEV